MTYNVNADFCFPEIKADTELVDGERQTYEFPLFIMPAEWMEQYYMLTLGQGYSTPVPIKLKPWQVEPVNAIARYEAVMLAWSTQIGKSTCAEGMYYWQQDYDPMNAMLCYAKKETIESVFDERIREQILCNSRMRRLWDGNPDNLTKKRCKLRTFVMRVASAHVRDDIASFTAPFIVASECSKYSEIDYDVMLLLRGRQAAGVERGKS